MASISYARHQFPPAIIRHTVWLYLRFTLSFRDVEELLAERGIEVSYESVRRWVAKFGPIFARELRRRRPWPSSQWHLDEMAVQIGGKGYVTGIRTERSRGRRDVKSQAAVAAFYVIMASALNTRSVGREMRWGWSEKVF